jgi:hypothetical protein
VRSPDREFLGSIVNCPHAGHPRSHLMETVSPHVTLYAPNETIGGLSTEEWVNELIGEDLVHSIHVSELNSHRSCRQRWYWAYIEDLHSAESVKALEFGIAYHRAMEVFYDPATWHLDKDVLATHAIAEFGRENERILDRLRQRGPQPEWLDEDFAERVRFGTAMLDRYFRFVAPTADTFTPVDVEVGFEVPLTGPNGTYVVCRCSRCWARTERCENWGELLAPKRGQRGQRGRWLGLPVTLGGRLDLLAEDNQTGELGILDWKTTARLMTEQQLDVLFRDPQISMYLLAMHKLGIPARTFWYHEQLKAEPEAPEPMARRRKGCLYSTSKQLHTTYDLYYQTVAEGDPTGLAEGAYDEYLLWLRTEGPQFWQRTTVRRNNHQLQMAEKEVFDQFLDMLSERVYINPGKFTCTYCQFADPCLAKQRGENYQHTLNTLYVKADRL